MSIIKTKHLSYHYIRHDEEGNVEGEVPAVKDVNLSVEPGEFIAILGHNGSGKSTLAKHFNALLLPSEGCIVVDGMDTADENHTWDVRSTAGMVFQNPDNQIIGQVVEEDVGFGPENLGVPTKEIWERVEESLKAVGMYEYRKYSPNKLSGGQKQRVSIAGVLAMHPKCIVLDEPTANLDQEAIARLHDQISALKQQGCTIVVAEHRLYFLTDLIDRAFYLRSGVLERAFTGEQFRRLPDPEREALGLRTLTPAVCTLPAVESAGSEEGLSVEGLTCSFRKGAPVFRDLSFSARPGEVVAITGPNGVGKTTLSRCLCGLLKEQAGQILLNGKPLNRKGRQRSAFCVMQDVNHQLFSDSVWGECRMSAPEASDDQISEVLDSLHLLPFRERHPMSLSGGQKQRLAVATALLSEKPMLIFDEPTSGLDYARMVEVSGVIRSLARHERIVLVVTHDQEFMQRACDRVLRL